MCLAIAPNSQCSNGLFARTWRQISSTPLRLFSFGAGLHLALNTGLVAYSVVIDVQLNVNAIINAFLYGIVALLVYGCLMTWIPKKYALSPVHHGRYNSVYLLMFIALLTLETGALISDELVTAGIVLLIPGWIIAFQGIQNIHSWIQTQAQTVSRAILFLLLVILTCLLLSIVVSTSDNYQHLAITLASINVISWLMIMFALKVLLSKAPEKVRVITV
jgi:hypothetical protein